MPEEATMKNILLSDLLVQTSNSNLTEGAINLKTPNFHPHFDKAEVTIIGNPTSVAAPLGNGLHVTNEDGVVYTFPVSKPWPCPFDIAECSTGITVSFWFRRNYVVTTTQNHFVRFGNVFMIYAPRDHKYSVITMRWYNGNGYWYGYTGIPSGKWNLVASVINDTHIVGYLNGLRKKAGRKLAAMSTVDINNELYVSNPNRFIRSNFSVDPIWIWDGRLSPVYNWRLFQKILPDQDENWS